MTRRVAATLALWLGLAAPAFADTIDVLKHNTLLLHEAGGRHYTLLVGDDGAMQQVNSAVMWAAGFWTLTDGSFCWTARGAAKICIPLPADKDVGGTWDITGPTGQLVWTAEIRADRADLRAVAASGKTGDSGQ